MGLRYVKLFSYTGEQDSDEIENNVRRWVDETGSKLVGCNASGSVLICLYEPGHVAADATKAVEDGITSVDEGVERLDKEKKVIEDIKSSASESPPQPQPAKPSSVPHVPAYVVEDGKRKAVKVMAGIFPVAEGAPLHPEDDEAAPELLVAEGVDLSRYQGMIVGGGND
jgi:hypothetical protein